MINYYKILGISNSVSGEEIKEAYRKKALKYHPDVNDSPKSHSRFQEISEAYTTLIDPLSREKYDIVLAYGFEGIADAIRKERAPKHRDPAYVPKSAEFVADYMERKSKPVKKDRQTIIIENLLFASMIMIGLAAFTFACIDLMAEQWAKKTPGVSGMVFSIMFFVLLALGWKLVLGRKFKF